MVYVAFVLDAFSRRILGWRAASSLRTDLVLDALEMAIWTRARAGVGDLTGLVAHHDAGSQYTSIHYTERLAEVGAAPSVGSVGDAYDNPSPRARSACSEPRSSGHAARGAASTTSRSRPSSGSTGTTTGAFNAPAATSPRPSTSRSTNRQHPALAEALVQRHESPATAGRFTAGTMSRWSSVSLDRFASTPVRATSRSGAGYPARCSSLYCFAPVKPSAPGS